MPDASLFRVATPSEKLFSGSYLKSRLQFSVRDYYTIIASADWKHMVTGLTLSLLFQSSPRMCGHSLRYKLTSLVHAKYHPNLAVTKRTGARELGIWSPYFTRVGRFFPFCRYFHHLSEENYRDGSVPFTVQFPGKIVSFNPTGAWNTIFWLYPFKFLHTLFNSCCTG